MENKYTVGAGRLIERDGKPFVVIHGVAPYNPVEIDDFTRYIATVLNAFEEGRIEKL